MLNISQVTKMLHARALSAQRIGADVVFDQITTDSRQQTLRGLFVALSGDQFDGHAFVAQAQQAGAVAALVHHAVDVDLPQIIVDDPLQALQQLAAAWRQQHSAIKLIAITGSNGKTSVKEMLRSICTQAGETLATQGNLNNHIGCPLTLLQLRATQRFAVIEMGANHAGEIKLLSELAQPDIALINNVMPSHLAGFGSLHGIATVKAEIFTGLSPQGIAIINADDAFAPDWRNACGNKPIMDFSLQHNAEVMLQEVRKEGDFTSFQIRTPFGCLSTRWQLLGRHNLANALAATTAALAAGITDLNCIAHGLASAQIAQGRLQPIMGIHGTKLISDCYNANPGSLAAGLAAVESSPRWLIFADMLELGTDAVDWHRQAGELAKQQGYERLFAVGELAQETVAAFGAGAAHFADRPSLAAAVKAALQQTEIPPSILIKGSNGMKLPEVVASLRSTS